MTDEKDLEIARLRGQLEASQTRSGSVVGAAFKVLGVLIGLAVVIVGAMAILGSRLPEGYRYEEACKRAAGESRAAECMRDMEATYRGPDRYENRANAAAQWARDHGVPMAD